MATLKKIVRVFFGVIGFSIGIALIIVPIIDESSGDISTPWWLILVFLVLGVLFAAIGWRLIRKKWPWDQ